MKKLTASTKFEILGSNNQVVAVFKVKSLKQAKRVKADKVVTVKDIRNKYQEGKELDFFYCADINLTQKSIVISGYHIQHVKSERTAINRFGNLVHEYDQERRYFERSFKIGDEIEYGSYNLIYTAPIQNITKTYVEVKDCGRTKRMKLQEFISRNYNLDLEEIAKKNLDTSYYI